MAQIFISHSQRDRSIVDFYVLTALSAGAGIGAALDEKDRGRGAAKGLLVGIGGLLVHSITKPFVGYPVQCLKCHSNFSVHLPGGVLEFRCANCNADWILDAQQQAAGIFQTNESQSTQPISFVFQLGVRK